MTDFEKYLHKKNSPMPREHLDLLEQGEEMSSSSALQRSEVNKLFNDGYLEGEDGFCRLNNGSMYTSVLTQMPGLTLEMINWWFWWHALEGIRYRIWYPEMHFDISSDFRGHYNDDSKSYAERLHLSSHLVTEDVGMGKEEILIYFMNPIDFGFDAEKLNSNKETIICANVGSPSKGLWFVDMCHFVRVTNSGVEMRSRFWIGHKIRKMKSLGQSIVNHILNQSFVKRSVIPKKSGSSMFHHCSQEYHNLASFLPQLYQEEY